MLIFVAGVHGVGKGTLLDKVNRRTGTPVFSASKVIRENRGKSAWLPDKRVTELDENQIALIRGLSTLRAQHNRLIVDGHFVLRDASGNIARIPASVFEALSVDKVYLLTREPESIVDSLAARDNVEHDRQGVAALQEAEIEHGSSVCSELGISFGQLETDGAKADFAADTISLSVQL